MSSSPSNTTPSQEPTHPYIHDLLCIVRRANEHYSKVAKALRHSLRPTYHARKRARSLRLRVSIEAALKLDQRQISSVPLPIIELVTPLPQEVSRARPILICEIPQGSDQEIMLSSAFVYTDIVLNTPASLKEAPTSRWSVTTIDSGVDEGIVEEEGISFSSDFEDVKALPFISVLEAERVSLERNVRRPFAGSVSDKHSQGLDVPVDVDRFSWSSYLSSGSSSSSTSSGPATPQSTYNIQSHLNLNASIKRKSKVSDVDLGATLEKRPKYARKSWVNAATKRIIRKMPTALAL
ncbi:hypothetical protein CPB84DRAFT_134856 [Gymnopilus junonius]|uniref:Uncharacterized protein n=1 Tax=Gymnopilus junonius TaxID=109634 RepID=A0A9P5TJI7_GYMJU|nr:hypothetical protein CPB84DRAFT_134856 [Gymnopilus junonius]